jgi:hypothetical protein
MTLLVAWVRRPKGQDSEELVFASDSRLRFGGAWDACPKLFPTARGDTVLGFAGDTMWAYPLLLQAANHMALHHASRTREHDIHRARGHLERVFRHMLKSFSDPPKGNIDEDPPTLFVMGGGFLAKTGVRTMGSSIQPRNASFRVGTERRSLRNRSSQPVGRSR